jgi:hypothetical protein
VTCIKCYVNMTALPLILTEYREQMPGVQIPCYRPRERTRPCQSRTSMANLYSPEVTEKKAVGGFKNYIGRRRVLPRTSYCRNHTCWGRDHGRVPDYSFCLSTCSRHSLPLPFHKHRRESHRVVKHVIFNGRL